MTNAGMFVRCTIAISLCVSPMIANGQVVATRLGISAGTRVRVSAPGIATERSIGQLLSMTTDTLSISTEKAGTAILRFPVGSIQRLEVSKGRNRLKWGIFGGVAGGVLGGAIGAAALRYENKQDPLSAIAGFLGGGAIGLVGGAILGAVAAPERWQLYDSTGINIVSQCLVDASWYSASAHSPGKAPAKRRARAHASNSQTAGCQISCSNLCRAATIIRCVPPRVQHSATPRVA